MEVSSICRYCTAFCPILVKVENGRALSARGNPAAKVYEGYTCPKGRAIAAHTNHPDRILHPLERFDGGFRPIGSVQAIDAIAERIRYIVDRHGPRAVAIYIGNGTMQHPFGAQMAIAMLMALGSRMIFTPVTIDKPAEKTSMAMHGYWMAGAQSFAEAHSWMIFGANPVISKSNGAPWHNPGMRLKQATAGGMKLIVVDPRQTETAKRAAIHLQARPGTDHLIAAAMIHIILMLGLEDQAFIQENCDGLESLRLATAPFTPAAVAAIAGLQEQELIDAARMFAEARSGMAVCGTGPSFSGNSNLPFYLVLCLNSLCGRWPRAGERAVYPNVLLPPFTPKAQAMSPYPVYGPEAMRVHGLRESAAGMPTAALADEILAEGEGQIRALFCIGSNPASAVPDTKRMKAALGKLDLLVSIDAEMSATAAMADYVIAPKMPLEVPALTYTPESVKYVSYARGQAVPWAQYAPAAVKVPPVSDLLEEHEFFYQLSRRLKLQLNWVNFHGMGKFIESPTKVIPLPMDREEGIALDEIFELATSGSRVPLDDVKAHPDGHDFDINIAIHPKDEGWEGRLSLAAPEMMQELATALPLDSDARSVNYPYRLICRRLNNSYNSIAKTVVEMHRGKTFNPLSLHPEDMLALGICDGAKVEIRSEAGMVPAVAESDPTLRRGVVSLAHGYGPIIDDAVQDPHVHGTNVNMLIGLTEVDIITGIPRMSNVPVSIRSLD